MDILTIAQREGDRHYSKTNGDLEKKAAAYLEAVAETRKRGRKAEEIVAAGLVARDDDGTYTVNSQNGEGAYTVDVDVRACDCPDRQHRPWLCKHLQAAVLHAAAHPEIEADGERVVLEVTGYKRGVSLINKKLTRVRVNGGSYREARTPDFDAALEWLQSEGYALEDVVTPSYTMGTAKVLYVYAKPENHDDALPADRPRQRDRLFKATA